MAFMKTVAMNIHVSVHVASFRMRYREEGKFLGHVVILCFTLPGTYIWLWKEPRGFLFPPAVCEGGNDPRSSWKPVFTELGHVREPKQGKVVCHCIVISIIYSSPGARWDGIWKSHKSFHVSSVHSPVWFTWILDVNFLSPGFSSNLKIHTSPWQTL